ncbi:MAG: NADH-quinone oxidoreductase subunit NuoE [Phycisphaerae bacterium]|nr:NADH-quinone oxidoreductase subunit NuoE [Phycisphaerae bacterium]
MTALGNVQQGISRSGVVTAPFEQALFAELQMAIDFYDRAPDALIQILHRAQELFGYLREDVIKHIARELRLPISHVYGVIGFYSFFSLVPQGKFTINVCTGTACYVRGAETVLRSIEKELSIKSGQTTADGKFSLRCARCVGACGLAPVMMISDHVHGQVKSNDIKKVLKAYK